MLREFGIYPALTRVDIPMEVGDLPVPPYVDCYIHDAESRLEGYGESAGGGRFIPGDYRYAFQVLQWLLRQKCLSRGHSFLEWGSGQGVTTILAQLLGLDATGVELDERLVMEARLLAARYDTTAHFVHGTYDRQADAELDLYTAKDRAAVYVYPWPGEESFFLRLFEETAPEGAYLLMCLGPEDIRVCRKQSGEKAP